MLPETDDVSVPEMTSGTETPGGGSSRSLWWSIGAICAIVVVAVVGAMVLATRAGDDGNSQTDAAPSSESLQTLRYLVPNGTGDRIDAGEDVTIIPKVLHIPIGTTIQIVNEDTRSHTVGGYYVRAGDTLDITYPRKGLYMNACSTNTDELVYIYVDPPADAEA